MRVLLLSRYDALPGPSRYRFYQYFPFLKDAGIDVTVSPLLTDDYVRCQYESGKFALSPLPAIYARRLRALVGAGRFDVVWVEKEALPWLPAWLELLPGLRRVPYVLDYDDAVFHSYDQHRSRVVRRLLGGKIAALIRRAALVMVGNDYLREYAERSGAKRIEWVPSVVDLARYPMRPRPENNKYTVGWWGSPPNSRHLKIIASALSEVCRGGGGTLRVLGGWKQELPRDLPVEYVPFSAADEVEPSESFDVGIMPLPDGPWERGKCGLKLIHYMACGLPTVASPVGVNSQIVEHGVTGFLASTHREWVEALCALRDSPALRRTMGQAGRMKVERLYSLQVNAPRVAQMLLECAPSSRP
jgi:glycosyltransferase involved in cell wall biosynthesis